MWVGSGLTPWFHRVPTVMTRGACQILGRVAGQFSHFSQVERHMAYTLVSSVRTLRLSVQMALSQLGTTFTTFLFHRWNQRICLSQNNVCWMMWVGSGLTPWFHGVPTVMIRGACQILGRVAGQFSHFSQVERHMAYTLLGVVFVTSVIYHWNQRISESQDQ
ncbi:hypothetical protein PROFUN_07659, partial [Planoprotostelium fungivorum]